MNPELFERVMTLPKKEQTVFLELLNELEGAQKREKVRTDFIAFAQAVWPNMIVGRHHKLMANAFERIAKGELRRLIIACPPRFGKSEMGSYLLPAWYMGLFPERKIIQATHTAELSHGFGRKVRNLIDSESYKVIFPDTQLRADSKAAGRWNTSKGGDYHAVGTFAALAGKGADLCVIDDPISEQEALTGAHNADVYNRVWDWFLAGPRQRLQPSTGCIVIIATRWSKSDLTGRVLAQAVQNDEMGDWEVIEFPAILPSGNSLWPEFWPLKELEALKKSLPVNRWMAQYQQNPISEEGAIIKREWWKRWRAEQGPLPHLESVIVSWDTAYEKTQRADYSACTVWGVFTGQSKEDLKEDAENQTIEKRLKPKVILMHAERGQWEFPDLKRKAVAVYREWKPDLCIIETKAAGGPLLFELRAMGIPVQEFKPVRGNDKVVRANAVADMFASGFVYAPDGVNYIAGGSRVGPTRWAEEVIEEAAEFPYGSNDDYVDTLTQALLRIRQGGFIRVPSDDELIDSYPVIAHGEAYY